MEEVSQPICMPSEVSLASKGMSVIVGIVIVAVITWIVATFGITWFHRFEQ